MRPRRARSITASKPDSYAAIFHGWMLGRRRLSAGQRAAGAISGPPFARLCPVQIHHAYCDFCEAIRAIQVEATHATDESGRYLGADLKCTVCGCIVCRLFEVIAEALH